jgi:hypothetical protein
MRGVGHRHERAVRCDGRKRCDGRSRRARTVKSCGSGVAVLAPSLREGAQATEAKQPFSGKSTKQAVKPLRREGRDASAEPVCSCAISCQAQTRARDRGCGTHPVFPAPSCFEEGKRRCKPRAEHVTRIRTRIQFRRVGKGAQRRAHRPPPSKEGGHAALCPPYCNGD